MPSRPNYRNTLPTRPPRIYKLNLDSRGYPIPWFAAVNKQTGEIDFRLADSQKLVKALFYSKCWICGDPMGRFKTFVIGPLAALTRASHEPPSHAECALYAVRACPYIVLPKAQRNATNMEHAHTPSSMALDIKPEVFCVWTTTAYKVTGNINQGEVILTIGNPTMATWYKEGREATFDEVSDAVTASSLKLLEMKMTELQIDMMVSNLPMPARPENKHAAKSAEPADPPGRTLGTEPPQT